MSTVAKACPEDFLIELNHPFAKRSAEKAYNEILRNHNP